MIAFFTASHERSLQVARHLASVTDEVDTVFRTIEGRYHGNRTVVYTVGQGSDAAYAAARVALRRGATRLIPVLHAACLAAVAEEKGLGPGDLVPVGAVWDLRGLAPALDLLPDSAREFPVAVQLPGSPAWRGSADGVSVGTLPGASTSLFLYRHLYNSAGIAVLDLQASGYADAAAELKCGAFHPIAQVAEVRSSREVLTGPALQRSREFDRAIEAIMAR